MKKIFVLILTCLLLFGCSKKIEKFYLNEKYYGSSEFISINDDELENLLKNKESFVIFTYNNYCSLPISCESVFKSFMEENNISFIYITYEEFKNTSLHDTVSFAPSVIIIKNGNIVSYLDAENNDDLEKYQDLSVFSDWINKYIYIEK